MLFVNMQKKMARLFPSNPVYVQLQQIQAFNEKGIEPRKTFPCNKKINVDTKFMCNTHFFNYILLLGGHVAC